MPGSACGQEESGTCPAVRKPGSAGSRHRAGGKLPSGRLVVHDSDPTGKPIEPELEKSIVVIEYPSRGEHGPLWIRGGIPVISADGEPYKIRNRSPSAGAGDRKTSRSVTAAMWKDDIPIEKESLLP